MGVHWVFSITKQKVRIGCSMGVQIAIFMAVSLGHIAGKLGRDGCFWPRVRGANGKEKCKKRDKSLENSKYAHF